MAEMVQPDAAAGVNEYALVAYVPAPLGSFLDELRNELVPRMPPGRSHVTVLQPRPLLEEPLAVWKRLCERTARLAPFRVEATRVEVFEETGVVFLALGDGSRELERMHRLLNRDGAAFPEPYPFRPHITLAMGLERERLDTAVASARQRWMGFGGGRDFVAKRFHFVRNTRVGLWMDLAEVELSGSEEPGVPSGSR